jgi:hypothetical protein
VPVNKPYKPELSELIGTWNIVEINEHNGIIYNNAEPYRKFHSISKEASGQISIDLDSQMSISTAYSSETYYYNISNDYEEIEENSYSFQTLSGKYSFDPIKSEISFFAQSDSEPYLITNFTSDKMTLSASFSIQQGWYISEGTKEIRLQR